MKKMKYILMKPDYQKVLETVYDVNYYCEWTHVDELENVRAIRHDNNWVSEIVEQREVQRMTGETPLFIVSQTGTGKTTFIFDNCLPVAEKEKKKILYLCNRAALKNQIKKEAIKHPANKTQYVDGKKVEEYNDYLTSKGIAKEHRFGYIDVYAYQEMITFPEDKVEEYAVVVMDEAHFFISDAKFNPYTQEILEKIARIFKDTRRIYLTATPRESFGVICEVERSFHKQRMDMWSAMYNPYYNPEAAQVEMSVVVVDEDYTYLQPRFFENIHELQKMILRNSSGKWLIFVRVKETAAELMKELKLPEEDVAYYDADTDKELEQYKTLIEHEELTHRITISTKVLDVGVNIKTENVNVVVFEDDPLEIKQMVGRKRRKEKENVTVYFYVPTMEELNQRLGRVRCEISEFKKLQASYKRGNYDSISAPLYISNGEIHINDYYGLKSEKDEWRYEVLIDKMSKVEPGQEKYVYAYYILHQFQLNLPGIQRYFYNYESEDVMGVKLRECLLPYLDQEIMKDALKDVAENIFNILPDPRKDKRSDRNIGVRSINKAISPYGYCVESMNSIPVSYRIKLTDIDGGEDNV